MYSFMYACVSILTTCLSMHGGAPLDVNSEAQEVMQCKVRYRTDHSGHRVKVTSYRTSTTERAIGVEAPCTCRLRSARRSSKNKPEPSQHADCDDVTGTLCVSVCVHASVRGNSCSFLADCETRSSSSWWLLFLKPLSPR